MNSLFSSLSLLSLLSLLPLHHSLQTEDRRVWQFVMEHLDMSDPDVKRGVIAKDWGSVGEKLLDAYQDR